MTGKLLICVRLKVLFALELSEGYDSVPELFQASWDRLLCANVQLGSIIPRSRAGIAEVLPPDCAPRSSHNFQSCILSGVLLRCNRLRLDR